MAEVPNHLVRRYDSITEFVAAATHKRHKDMSSSCEEIKGYGEGGWYGTKSFEEARELCLGGWDTARPKVDALLTPLREQMADILDTVPVRIHDMIGAEPDIDRYLSGEIDCMWDDFHVEMPKNGKVFTVLISDAVNSGVSGDTLLKRGTAILALVEAFQILGYDLELWIESSVKLWSKPAPGSPYPGEFSTLVRIHRAGDVLDINTLMFPLANPSWFRRFTFGHMEGENDAFRQAFRVPGGYGQAADLRCVDLMEPSFVLTKGGEGHDRTMDNDPVAWVLKTLEAQGVYEPAEGRENG